MSTNLLSYCSVNPASEELIQSYSSANSSQINSCLSLAHKAQPDWARTTIDHRLLLLEKFKNLLIIHQQELARLITLEMGKLFTSAIAEVSSAVRMCDFLLLQAEEILVAESRYLPEKSFNKIIKEAYGVTFNITPWNYPVWLPLRSALPALIAGNAVVLKPAPNVAGCALRVQELIWEAGFPKELFSVLLLVNHDAEILISDDRIAKIIFTGSLQTGQRLASLAGQQIKPITLELGGSDPFIVLADADLEVTAQLAADARCRNAGQVCCSAKRFLIDQNVYLEFSKYFLKAMSEKRPGDPFNADSSYGPLARVDIAKKLEQQIALAIKEGATEVLPARQISQRGFYYSPGIFNDPFGQASISKEEVFGPVAVLHQFQNLDQAVEIANSSPYGLAASIFTQSAQDADYFVSRLAVGMVGINKTISGDAFLPFGGYKKSGYGRESGKEGLLEYVQTKTIVH